MQGEGELFCVLGFFYEQVLFGDGVAGEEVCPADVLHLAAEGLVV